LRLFGESRKEIIALYLFGSTLTGRNPEDVDIAVLIDERAVGEQRYQYGYAAALTAELMSVFHRNDVDVVLLNRPKVCLWQGIPGDLHAGAAEGEKGYDS
jgi:predicted nucleotidyltransferase